MNGWFLQIFNGISLGSILLLISFGLAFAFGLMGVINMAHAEFIMVGAYTTYLFQTYFAQSLGGVGLGLWFICSLLAAFLIAGLLGILLEVVLIRHLYGRPLDTLLATWGVGLVLQQTARSILGAPNVNVSRPDWLSAFWEISEGIRLPYARLFIIGLVLFVTALIYFYLQRTSEGRRLRAVMQNREMASCLGVPSRRVDAITFGIGAGLAGIAGAALTLIGPIGPTLGVNYIVDAFMVVVLGGAGKLRGTILAAFSIGLFNTVVAKVLIDQNVEAAATVAKVFVLLLIILFLQWRPKGLVVAHSR